MKKRAKLLRRIRYVVYLSAIVFLVISVAAWAVVIAWIIWANIAYENPYDFNFADLPSHFNDYVFLFLSFVLGPVFYFLLDWGIIVPLINIYYAIEQIGKGDYNVHIKPSGFKSMRIITNKINDAAKELSAVESMRNDLTNHFSHELKTPIVSIAGFARLLKNKNTPEKEREEYIDIIAAESDRLSKLSSDVLTLTRLENTTIVPHITTFNITEQIRRVVVILLQKWTDKGITVDFDCDEFYVDGNHEFLEQVWINLLDNAIKFSPENGTVVIHMKTDKSSLTVSITDEGSGMTEDAIQHAFEKFYQHDLSHKSVGNGIGLSVVKRICELHGGSVKIARSDESGTTLEVTLPKEKN